MRWKPTHKSVQDIFTFSMRKNFYYLSKISETEEVSERPNKRLESGQKGVKVKGIGIAKNLPQGFFDDKTKDANIRGVETPADKEAR